MQAITIMLVLLGTFAAGAVSHRIYSGASCVALRQTMEEGNRLLEQRVIPVSEAGRTSALRATVESLRVALEANDDCPEDEAAVAMLEEQIIFRVEALRGTLNYRDTYYNEYAVKTAIDEANSLLRDLGSDWVFEAYGD
jgi:hypothetical protein